jgi:hypothetical protein
MPRNDASLPDDDDDALDKIVNPKLFTQITQWLEDARRAIKRIPLPTEDLPRHFAIIYEGWSNISSDMGKHLAMLRSQHGVNDVSLHPRFTISTDSKDQAEQLPRDVRKARQSRRKVTSII